MRTRKGLENVNRTVLIEFAGVVTFIVIFSLVVAHFLGLSLGCFGNTECMEAREELRRFVNDVNQACEDSTLSPVSEPTELGTYDFGASSAVGLKHPNIFRAAKLKDTGDFVGGLADYVGGNVNNLLRGDWRQLFEDGTPSLQFREHTREWTVEMEAENCDQARLCVLFQGAENCHTGVRGGTEDFFNGGHVPFWIPGFDAEGTVVYTTPEPRHINLRWVN